MRHRGQKLALRSVGHLRLGDATRIGDRALLRRAPLREIARHLRKTDQRTVWIAHRGNDDVRPEKRAVPSNAPSLVLEAAHLGRDLELECRLPTRDILRRIEGGEVSSDDLTRRIALDAARALVPGRDHSLGIEHEDGVVLHGLNELTKAFLACAERLLCRAAIGEITRDLREPDVRTTVVEERRDDDVRPDERAVLPEPPTLVLESPIANGGRELHWRLAARDVRGRVEDREVAPDDLRGRVSLHSPRPLVPGEHAPFGVEREDRVVAHAVDEKPI